MAKLSVMLQFNKQRIKAFFFLNMATKTRLAMAMVMLTYTDDDFKMFSDNFWGKVAKFGDHR